MTPHTNARNGWVFLALGVALLCHGALSVLNLCGAVVPGTLAPVWLPLLLWSGIAYIAFGWAYLRGITGIFGERADGTIFPVRFVFLLPIHLQNYLGLLMVRRLSRFTVFHEAAPGLYRGGLAFPHDARQLRQAGVSAVLDLTAEFVEPKPLRSGVLYHCLPLLDATAPTRAELESGARWIQQVRAEGKTVYVHCAKGAGRSATFVAAYLVASGLVSDVQSAVQWLQQRRMYVKLVGAQEAVLAQLSPAETAADGVIR